MSSKKQLIDRLTQAAKLKADKDAEEYQAKKREADAMLQQGGGTIVSGSYPAIRVAGDNQYVGYYSSPNYQTLSPSPRVEYTATKTYVFSNYKLDDNRQSQYLIAFLRELVGVASVEISRHTPLEFILSYTVEPQIELIDDIILAVCSERFPHSNE